MSKKSSNVNSADSLSDTNAVAIFQKIVREEISKEISPLKKQINEISDRMDNLESSVNEISDRMDNLESRIERIKKSRGAFFIPPRRTHVYSAGNSMDSSDIEEVPNSAYK